MYLHGKRFPIWLLLLVTGIRHAFTSRVVSLCGKGGKGLPDSHSRMLVIIVPVMVRGNREQMLGFAECPINNCKFNLAGPIRAVALGIEVIYI